MTPSKRLWGSLWLLCLLGTGWLPAQDIAPRLYFGAKFEPVDQVLNGAGQSDELAFAGYLSIMGPDRHPVFYMEYTGARDTPAEVQEELDMYARILAHYPPGVGLQLGLSMTSGGTGYEAEVAAGLHDEGLQALARRLDSLDRKVFVRIGYEANGFWNGYTPASYRAAFRHVTDILRAASDSIATVWCVHPLTSISNMMSYYPGDAYVDWWSIDLFQTHFILNQNTAHFLDSAEAHHRPVLIGEANPTETGLGQGQQSWDDWYAVFFQLIRAEPVIKGFSYINRDWAYLGGQPDWGNSKLQDDTLVACRFREEMDRDLYRHLQPAPAQHVSLIEASADGLVFSANPTASYGQEPLLRARQRSQDTLMSYIEFDLTGLPLGTITSAQLWLLGENDQPNRELAVLYQAGTGWAESSLTWAQRPAVGDSLGTLRVRGGGRTDINSLDVTALLLDSLAAGRFRLGFALGAAASPGVNFTFHSRDRQEGYRPVLQLIHDGEAMAYQGCNALNTGSGYRQGPELRLFPNPTPGPLRVEWADSGITPARLSLYDSQGCLLQDLDRLPTGQPVRLDLGYLPAGWYALRAAGAHRGSPYQRTHWICKE